MINDIPHVQLIYLFIAILVPIAPLVIWLVRLGAQVDFLKQSRIEDKEREIIRNEELSKKDHDMWQAIAGINTSNSQILQSISKIQGIIETQNTNKAH